MSINVCIAGTTGWTGSVVARHLLASGDFRVVSAIARSTAGQDLGTVLGLPANGVVISAGLDDALVAGPKPDVLIDYTDAISVRARTFEALEHGIRVVVGSSGLTAVDFAEIEAVALARNLGVIASGNFSITATLAKHFSLLAAKYIPSWELIDFASAGKLDAPSGTVRELAESLGAIAPSQLAIEIADTHGEIAARGATIAGTQVHSVRLPGIVIAFAALFGLPDELLTIRHDGGASAEPYAVGTLLAARRVMDTVGLIRGLDTLLFGEVGSD